MSNINQEPYDEDGNPHGEWIQYYTNGKLDYHNNFVHGISHGFSEAYNHDDTLLYRGYYNMGIEIGFWLFNNKKHYYLNLI